MKVKPDLYHVSLTESSYWPKSDGTPEEKLQHFNKEQEKFRKFPFLELEPFDKDSQYSQRLIKADVIVLSGENLLALAVGGIKFEVQRKVDVDVDITKQLMELANKPLTLSTGGGTTYNNKCEVHMPGNMLSLHNEICLLEDSCTDELQRFLMQGWRIIAACPQPDQRRPDYVLGRFNPELDEQDTNARRAA